MYTDKVLLIILISLVIVIYFQYYAKYNESYEVLQAYTDNINNKLLSERYPLLLYDRVVNPQNLIDTLFYGLYIFKKESVLFIGNPILNSSKYLLLFNNLSNCFINIVSPKYRNNFIWRKQASHIVSLSPLSEIDVPFITIKLKKNQILILPPYWIYQTAKKIKRISLADIPSKIYEIFYKMRFKAGE